MKNKLLVIFFTILFLACSNDENKISISSPNNVVDVKIWIKDGKPYYSVSHKHNKIIEPSALGLVLTNGDTITNNLKISEITEKQFFEVWEQPWGEKRLIENNYTEKTIAFVETIESNRVVKLIFKVYDDGIGFRYEIPEQKNISEIVIMDELTEFVMHDNHEAWWIPAYKDNRYEYLYKKSPINDLDTVHTPFTMEADNGYHISIHEACLVNYAGMTLACLGSNRLKCDLAPWSDGTKVKTESPMKSPWRTIQIAENAGDLITSYLILNLNEPNKLDDLSWIKPTKYLGIWWGMHIGKYTFWESQNHGACTKKSKYYVDYCNKLGIDHLLIEGWNIGWTPQWYENRLHVFNFTKGTDDFDFNKVTDYARQNNVNIIGYHETGSNIDNYLAQIDDGMKMYHDAGMHSIKIGQVGSRLMLKEWHYGQYGVNYYYSVLQKAAEYQLTVNFHEPIKPTGLQRTFPHLMSGEGARGQEYNAWSAGNPPEHTVILPFTRLLGGPMDFTPGIFSIKPTRVHTTLAKQLALYITIYSPIQMLADLPENYEGQPAFKFLQDVPVNWETTKVLNAKIGDYYTVVRKDRASDDWYLGSITDESEREFNIKLDFLDENKKYRAEIYADALDAEFDKNPEKYLISQQEVDNHSELTIKLAKGGGQAIHFVAINEKELTAGL